MIKATQYLLRNSRFEDEYIYIQYDDNFERICL